MTLNFWCIPSVVVDIALYAWQMLTFFPDITSPFTFPPAYLDAIRYNLAVRLAPEFGVEQLSPVVGALAVESKAKIKNFNSPIKDMRCDPGLINPKSLYYNWISDEPAGTGHGLK